MTSIEIVLLIEKVKDIVHSSTMKEDERLVLQRELSLIRTHLLNIASDNVKYMARVDIYAELLNKMLDRASISKYD